MEKLQLKHFLVPYLPYDLKITWKNIENKDIIKTIELYSNDFGNLEDVLDATTLIKPVLIPLSELLNQKDCWNELYEQCSDIDENLDYLPEFTGNLFKTSLSYRAVSILIMWHFDVFGLIQKGLAKSILELENN